MAVPMNPSSALLSIFIGVATGLVAVLSNKFYWLKGYSGGDKEAPLWAGRLLFGLVSAGLILVGFRYFILGY
jgi:H+/Cl- antiporter ClcA